MQAYSAILDILEHLWGCEVWYKPPRNVNLSGAAAKIQAGLLCYCARWWELILLQDSTYCPASKHWVTYCLSASQRKPNNCRIRKSYHFFNRCELSKIAGVLHSSELWQRGACRWSSTLSTTGSSPSLVCEKKKNKKLTSFSIGFTIEIFPRIIIMW